MPRLLNVNNYHYRRGGAETVYLGHGDIFANAGWDVDWFAMQHPLNPPGVDEGFADLIDLEYMQGAMAKLKSAGAIIYNGQARRKIGETIERFRPDVAHLHNIYHHLSPSVLLELKQRGVPSVFTAHDLKLACPSYKMLSQGQVCERCKGGKVWNLAMRRCLKDSFALSALITLESGLHKALGLYRNTIDTIVTPSRFYRDKLIEWGWEPERIVHVPNFVDGTDRAAEPGAGHGPLLYFGRLSEEKGIGTLIRASKASGVAVRIAGTGPSAELYQRLAQEIDAPVEFMGYRSGADLEALIRDAKATVLPSEWYENGPMSVMESFLARRPVIGADIGGIPELVHHETTGWTFPAGDVEALAQRMAQVASSSADHRETLGEAGRAMVLREFNRDRYFDAMSGIYTSLT